MNSYPKCMHCKKHSLKGYYRCDLSKRIQTFECGQYERCNNFEYTPYARFVMWLKKFI